MRHEAIWIGHDRNAAAFVRSIEWRTILLLLGCYAGWIAALMLHAVASWAAIVGCPGESA